MKVSFKGIQVSHDEGICFLDLKKLSPSDKEAIAEELELYKKESVGASKKFAAEKAQKLKDKKAADKFVADFKKIMGAPRKQSGYLLSTFTALNNRYKLKLIIPKRNKNGTLPPLIQQYEIIYKFMEDKTHFSAKQQDVLDLLDKHYETYKEQRKEIYKKIAAQLTKKEEALRKKGRTPKAKPVVKPAPKPAAKPAAKPVAKPAAKPAPKK